MNKPFDLINEIQKRLEFVSVDFKGLNKSYNRKNPCDLKMLQRGLKSSSYALGSLAYVHSFKRHCL